MKYLLKIMYVGTDFFGYQVQPDKRTVQSVLQDAIEQVYGTRLDVKGSSRTDSGVHANAFYATFDAPNEFGPPMERLIYALNANLPPDISVIACKNVSDDFHVRHDVVFKEYVYKISDGPVRNPFDNNRSYYLPFSLGSNEIERMNSAAQFLVGRHDFKSFMASGSDIIDTVRDIKYINIVREDRFVNIYIAADGFLYNMVRIIAGTLVDVARGKISLASIPDIIACRDRSKAGTTLPACGLYLNKVVFNFGEL